MCNTEGKESEQVNGSTLRGHRFSFKLNTAGMFSIIPCNMSSPFESFMAASSSKTYFHLVFLSALQSLKLYNRGQNGSSITIIKILLKCLIFQLLTLIIVL